MKNKNLLLSLTLIASLSIWFFSCSPVQAQEEATLQNEEFHINIDKATIAKGYTVAAFKDKIKLSLVPGVLDEDTDVDALLLREEIPTPWQLRKISETYQFEFKNKDAYDNHTPFYIQLSYEEENDNDLKKVFFYDKNHNGWRPLPTRDYPEDNFVRSLIHLPFARIAVFSYPNVLANGKASWYAYKGGDFAASPDFPKGSIIRVINTDNDKFVDVTINDWGPERDKFPDRVIDLDKLAFAKIASLGAGIVNVKIEPISIVPDADGRELGVEKDVTKSAPTIEAKAAIAMDENTGKVVWQKNATSTLPLASLTKIVAIKTFLDTRPSLNLTVKYDKDDAEYNYEYCKPWESSKIKLEDGEELTLEDLIYASLVGSANNTIETIVRASGMPRDKFIQKMNESVIEWGASSTHFVEPTGLSPENVSSPADYAIILKEAMTNPIIQKTSTMNRYSFHTVNTERKITVYNTNKIIQTNKFTFTGSKTGYLDEAGYCLATRVLYGKGNVIVVLLGAETRDQSFNETIDLIKYATLKL
jgi:hypothetical protein